MALTTNQSFGQVIDACKNGEFAQRLGWNGKNMYIWLMVYESTSKELPHFNMFNARGDTVIGWLASQEDMLSNDWSIADNKTEFLNPRSNAESG